MDAEQIFNGPYTGERLNRVAFPLGGIGAGIFCLRGNGSLADFSLRHQPNLDFEPAVFAAVKIKGSPGPARILEGPFPSQRIQLPRGPYRESSGASFPSHFGFPRFGRAEFQARFPFGEVRLTHPDVPLRVVLTGWSPFIPGNSDDSCLPVAALEYCFTNASPHAVAAVFSFHAQNFMGLPGGDDQAVLPAEHGFTLWQPPRPGREDVRGAFNLATCGETPAVNYAWFRGGWFDAQTMLWKEIERGDLVDRPPVTQGRPSPGASLFVPFSVSPGATRRIRLLAAWHVPDSRLLWGEGRDGKPVCCRCTGDPTGLATYRPWYAGRFADIAALVAYWRENFERLRGETLAFTDCFYDTSLPPEAVEAVAANLSILKSPTLLRQADGRVWGWEGCCDQHGACAGSCTHVWNYAQALAHLFPDLERALRETEFHEAQNEAGHQAFRSYLPTRTVGDHSLPAAADGQLGGILADGMVGLWLAAVCGLAEPILKPEMVDDHVRAVHRHNFRGSLVDHVNPQRPGFALGPESGLLLCSWPRGGEPSLPFVYSNEVWTGIEYQVASHLIMHGRIEEGRQIVRAARARYDGVVRNPFSECELGQWYARALSSYALLQAWSGARYDAVEKALVLEPPIAGDFHSFLCTANGYGTVGVRSGKPFFETRAGRVEVRQIRYKPNRPARAPGS